MMSETITKARSITYTSSKQTFYTANLMVSRKLVDDYFRAYAYFRWIDDFIDVKAQTRAESINFVTRQRDLIDLLYRNVQPKDMTIEEEILSELIMNDKEENSKLNSYIKNMFAIIDFDAHRKGRLISQKELSWYTDCLAISVTDGLEYFLGNGYPFPSSKSHYYAAKGAHITHLLRDMAQDVSDGFINIPREYLEEHNITPVDIDSIPYRNWVRERVELAQNYFHQGKHYIDELAVLKCKFVGYWYCARFDGVLNAIKRDDYILRSHYNERRKPASLLNMALISITLSVQHINYWIQSNLKII